ncbi:diguanylate cyclase [Nitratidesulfovibrio sp. HK-II]|uniref:diguanylate cyclase n=1 Tax=Nitratidesulfovibrio sp. HK-II TaxID=2009266 RepID=UPI000E2EC085|nr:diguanylate cyclase [Nitratidesulfovibrio sp. HK-II]GBO98123.1 diguanylate cyclase with PAS/PAC sensor [Nitratidesulfovibrio sp. HK-II]
MSRWVPFRLTACLLCLLLPGVGGATSGTAPFTPAEQRFIRESGPVTLCVDPDWPPFEHVEVRNGQARHVGIAADIIELVARRTGLSFELLPTATWEESIAAARAGRCQALSFLNQTPQREAWLGFTDPLLTDPNVFITRVEHPDITDPAALVGETIVFPQGTAMEELIRKDYPNLKVLVAESEAQAIRMVEERKADMTMRSLIVAAYTIRQQGLFNLKIAGNLPEYQNKLRMGVVRANPLLRTVLNRGIRSLTDEERRQIVNRHVPITAQTAVDYWLVGRVAAVFALLAAVVLWSNRRLKRMNAVLERLARTDPLTDLPNRTRLNDLFRREVDRAKRYRRPFSIVILDIDNFKRVNDEYGHLAGDRTLQAFAVVVRDNVRGADTVGRWGGEEFLVLCPETTAEEAAQLAERLRAATRATPFEGGRTHTVSAGVAAFHEGDDLDALLNRADAALYRAKNAGRDRVEMA